ncbi:MAG TPA: hypothetical protein PKN57_08170 [Saprospiraceae bacterium]|nr:hypothetical protein [Saprospiraceae bacterium]MCC6688932.1 hypothetical protein [Saprospiraceae bacterium]HMV23204.1 hypothetical protein [Saprospiraceae bacterium]HMW74464.1 hypothetical protein [Saprospiraceae bacterium]HMX83229.1 hypothetical protein [Saprospiraceae bacterium]
MSLREKVNLFIYRYAEKGLEIFLMKSEAEDLLHLPNSSGNIAPIQQIGKEKSLIQLDETTNPEGNIEINVAFEAEYHEIPSLKHLLKSDMNFVADKIIHMLPDSEKGRFIALKEAIKKMRPHQNQALKELKDILVEKNLTKYL